MKKKMLLCLIIIMPLILITGCNEKNNMVNNNESKQIENTEGKNIINGYDLTLTEESSFSKISFKYPNGGEISNPITSLIINYPKKNSDENLFRVVMGEMYGTNIDNSMSGFTKVGVKTINGIEWSIYNDATGKNHYGTNIDYSNIVIAFIYDDSNLKEFEDNFMNNVKLN